MARLTLATRNRRQRQTSLILTWWNVVLHIVVVLLLMIFKKHRDKPHLKHFSSNVDRYPILHRHVYENDTMAISQIRMSRRCFRKLCHMLETFGGLKPSRNMNIDEQVAIFLHILAHNVKNRVIICRFRRSGERISRHFARVCNATIRFHTRLLKKPEPVPDKSTDPRWKWFKNCLGALDGTYIKCLVPVEEKPRYRTRKNDIATYVLGCSQDMQFIYVLTGWEGSAADGRVLRDALLRPNGLKVPRPEMEVDPFDEEGDNDEGNGDLGYEDVDNISMTSQIRHYRNWSPNEESKLVDALLNMTNTGTFKADNAFKTGYLQYLEQALKVSLPNSGLLANPHISSKLKTMKKDWQCVYDMVNDSNTSGFGYDPERKCVTAEDPVWEAYLQVHKDASRWKNRSFPHYEDLCIVFGKDRARGNRARDFVEMEKEVNVEETQESYDDLLDSDNAASRNTNFQKDETSPSVISRKGKSRSDDGFNNAVGLITESLKEISKDLSQGIKFDMKINELSEKIPVWVKIYDRTTTDYNRKISFRMIILY
ncbi:hypothetical protein OSB04_030849 [Centaurea solstitialis]|uniref:Transposase n=1 Tax=Centaurea solstitialis TaxID=347529 RepID=A0AA38W7J8_9ASTR|nr:hypothetical protein OSB04_030849 [Centaurea solstitialis]